MRNRIIVGLMCVAGIAIVLSERPELPKQVATDAKAMVGVKPKPITQEQREAAKASAQQAKSGEPQCKTVSVTVNPPEEAMAKARRNMSMDSSWTGVLEVLNLNTTTDWMTPPIDSLGVSAFGGTAAITFQSSTAAIDPPVESHDSPPPGAMWVGYYFKVTVNAGTDTGDLYLWGGDGLFPSGMPYTVPVGATKVDGDCAIEFAYTISDLYPKGERTADSLSTRNPMDYTDFSSSDSWFADETSQVTITASGHGLSLSDTIALPDTGEIDVSLNPWSLAYSFTVNRFTVDDTIYCRCSDLEFNGVAVDLSNLNLSNPGTGDAPDATQSSWKRSTDSNCARIVNSGGIAVYWTGTGNTTKGWTGTIWGPVAGTIKEVPGGHEDGTAYPGTTPQYTSNTFIDWEWDETEEEYVSYLEKWTGDFSYYHQHKSWEFEHEWRRLLSSTAVEIYQTDEWREANGEAVGEDTVSQNDKQLGVCVPWIDASDFTSEPWTENLVSIAHAASVNINDPPGYTRESLWVGSGGLIANPADNDEWEVADGSSAPKAGRSFLTRKWLRLDRLSGGWNPGDEYNGDWSIIDKANLPITTTLDDPDWHSTASGGCDVEDVTHWADYSYVKIELDAPQAGEITFTVNYSVAAISDPDYTCAEYRWDEYEYTRSQYVATYKVDVAAGSNNILLDLCELEEFINPVYRRRMHVVDSVEFALLENNSGSPQTWTLNTFALVHDPGETGRPEPTYHVWFKYNRAWDWPGTDWNGIACVVDGKDALELDYGYGGTYGYTRQEHKMLYIQHSEHCPTSGATGELHTLKPIARLVQELNYQEGWTATDNLTVDSSANKDADDNRLASALYWFDIRNNREYEFASSQDIDGCVCVGTFGLLAGIEQHWYVYNVPRGRLHGIAKNSAGERLRDTPGITIYENNGGTYTLLETLTTDEHGRFRSSPLRELADGFRVSNYPTTYQIANREYTTAIGRIPETKTRRQAVAMFAHPAGRVPWTVWIEGDYIYAAETASGKTTLGTIRTVDDTGDYDSVYATTDGNTIYVDARRTADEKLCRWYSDTHGESWTGPAVLS